MKLKNSKANVWEEKDEILKRPIEFLLDFV